MPHVCWASWQLEASAAPWSRQHSTSCVQQVQCTRHTPPPAKACSYTRPRPRPATQSDVVKVRLQTQSAGGGPILYRGFLHGARRIMQEEGVLALWRHGLAASVLRELVYSSLRMGLYPTMKSIFAPGRQGDVGLSAKIAAGMCTGALGSALATPTDLVKIAQQAEAGRVCASTGRLTTGLHAGEVPKFPTVLGAFRTVYAEGGLRGLYRGVTATTGRAALLTAGQLASYDHTKHVLRQYDVLQEGAALHTAAALVAGLAATTAAAPADLVKSRIMADRSSGGSGRYAGTLDCIVQTVRAEGPLGLFRGWTASYLRLGPHFVVSLPLLEHLRAAFGVGYM